jgi:nudix-type nucleoside diphosphatase (YffH/AdpP family)
VLRRILLQIWRILPLTIGMQWPLLWIINRKFLVGVMAIAFDDQERVLLLHHTYRRRYPWGLPGGWLGGGETPEEGALRELREETGFVVAKAQRLFECYMSPGSVTEKLVFFIAPYTPGDRKEQGGGLPDEGESVQTLELPFDEALAKVGSGEIRDAKTILLLQWAQLNRLFD